MNTTFDKKQFNFSGGYLTYGADRRFVARFKRGGMADFKKFLIANYSVEKYFYLTETLRHAPLIVLGLKGYESPNVRKARALGLL